MHSGDLLNRLMDDVTEITETVCYTIPKLTGTLVQLVLATYFIAKIDYRLALAVFFIMPVALVLSKSCFRKLRRLTRDIKDSDRQRAEPHSGEHPAQDTHFRDGTY